MNASNRQEGEENLKKRKHDDISCSEDLHQNDENQTFEKSPKASKKETNSLKAGEPKVTINLSKTTSTMSYSSLSSNPPLLTENQNFPPLKSPKEDICLESNNFSFTSKIKNKMPIVDKTGSLYNLVRSGGAFLAVGPKKYGKTFHITTLEAIYKQGKEWWETYCAHLDIVKSYHYDFPKHPVLKLDFNGVVGFEQLKDRVKQCLETLAKEYHLEEKFAYGFKPGEDSEEVRILFERLIREVANTTGKSLILLIDDYDQPIIRRAEEILEKSKDIKTIQTDPEIREMVHFVKFLLIGIKSLRVREIRGKNDPLIKFAYVTGTVSICQGGLLYGSDFLDLRRGQKFSELFDYTEEDAAKLSLKVPQQNDPSIFERLW